MTELGRDNVYVDWKPVDIDIDILAGVLGVARDDKRRNRIAIFVYYVK
jgi:hypothetical protein